MTIVSRVAIAVFLVCQAAHAASPETAAADFVQRFVAGDVAGMHRLWVGEMPVETRRFLEGVSAAKCLTLIQSTTDRVQQSDDRSEVSLTLVLHRVDRSGADPRIVVLHPVITVAT